MKCNNIHNDLISYLEGSLSREESNAIEKHLNTCDECMKFSDKLRVTLGYIDIEKEVSVTPGFADMVLTKLDNEVDNEVEEFSLINRMMPALTAAAVVLFAVFVGNTLAKQFSGGGDMVEQGYHEEFLYANEIYLEPIENFFLLTEENYEKD